MKRSLREIARDMRAAGEMLLEGATEIESAINVDFTGVAALLGGEPVKAAPFVPKQSSQPRRSSGNGKPKLTAEQKAQIRVVWKAGWGNLSKIEQTIPHRKELVRKLAAEYRVSPSAIAATIFNNPTKALARRHASANSSSLPAQ